jgi:serine/threonine protein kinase
LTGNSPHALPLGALIQEYRIDAVLGAGSFGITYKARDTYLGQTVAIKEFFPEEYVRRSEGGTIQLLSEQHAETYRWELDRFIGEGQVLATFRHPNIVRVWRYFAANNTAYMVMDYEAGESLKVFLKKLQSPPTERELRAIFMPVLEGLQEVHSKRYLHRDIKPGNIYIRTNSTPLLLDFGAARLEMAGSAEGNTSKLTVGYAPIEQYVGDAPQTPALDIYALGATLYRCLTGQVPVESTQRHKAVQSGQPDPLVEAIHLGKDRYHHRFLETVDWMMQIYPEARPQSVGEVLTRLRETQDTANMHRIQWQRSTVRDYKVIVLGAPGAGKTSALMTLSDMPPTSVGEHTSGGLGKPLATASVPLEYGLIKLSDSESVRLYSASGREPLELPWDSLKQGLIGVILLLDDSAEQPLREMDRFLRELDRCPWEIKIAMGITHVDTSSQPVVPRYHHHLVARNRCRQANPPIFEVDPRSRRDVSLLMQALLYCVDPGISAMP